MADNVIKRVIVAGKFDPLHDGHILHIRQAAALGNYLVVITHPDDVIKVVKDRCNIPLWARVEMINGILVMEKIAGEVATSVDKDGTVTKTLEMIRRKYPHDDLIFAKGGDRTPDNMPKSELDAAKQMKIRIAYGVGDQKNCSSKMPKVDFVEVD